MATGSHDERMCPRTANDAASRDHSVTAATAKTAAAMTAIPAVLFYNYFTQRVKLLATGMDDFSMEFLNIAERNFT